jgi:hypothetical protein
MTSLIAWTARIPFGITPVTRAVRTVLITMSRLVEPSPASCELPDIPARLVRGPVALVMPPRAGTEADVAEARCVLVLPLASADAFSTTWIVRMSSTWLARRSRPMSPRRAPGDQIAPGVDDGAEPGCSAVAVWARFLAGNRAANSKTETVIFIEACPRRPRMPSLLSTL